MVATRGRHLRTLALFFLIIVGIPAWASPQGAAAGGAASRLDRLLSEHITFDQLNEGFDRLADGRTVRQIVTL